MLNMYICFLKLLSLGWWLVALALPISVAPVLSFFISRWPQVYSLCILVSVSSPAAMALKIVDKGKDKDIEDSKIEKQNVH